MTRKAEFYEDIHVRIAWKKKGAVYPMRQQSE
jgi:hypothetical protein